MFISDTHLPQHFSAAMYHDADWYAKELEEVLLPSWYLVATMRDFPRSASCSWRSWLVAVTSQATAMNGWRTTYAAGLNPSCTAWA